MAWLEEFTWLILRFFLLLFLLWLGAHLSLRPRGRREPELVSHRGAAGLAPENTMVSVQTAVDLGARLIEVDVQRSADGVLLLMHDTTVDRTTDGTGAVANLSWAQIQELDAGSWFDPQFAGEPVPSLEELLTRQTEWPASLVLEAKDPELYPGMADEMAAMIERFQAEQRVLVVSFDHPWLAEFHERLPGVRLGRLAVWIPPFIPAQATYSVGVYWLSVVLDPTLIWRIHASGGEVWVWTVNDARIMRLMHWLGVDAVTTDYPDRWLQSVGYSTP